MHTSSTQDPHTHTASYRLPTQVRPTQYTLRLEPDLDQFTFAGEVYINVEVKEETRCITLHAVGLAIHHADCIPLDAQRMNAAVALNTKTEELTLEFEKALKPGPAKLYIAFTGILNDGMCGFYRSSYTLPGGEKRFMATTQFEATDARRCFPCWDEPNIKATFSVTLVVPDRLEAISNMPPEHIDTKKIPGKKIVQFAKTPPVSTYLLAFIAGDLECIESKTKDGVAVRVYTAPGKKAQGKFALDTAVKTLELFNDYYATPYPLPKLDLVAIPDFAAGAMENWGAITYRETALLIDPENSSTAAYQRVAYVIAHEIAHQWFGNLVTMDWWTHLWLNEGFATFVGYFAVNRLFPDWDIWTQVIGSVYAPALGEDALRSTHAIEVEVKHPSEISEIFDAISYEKGASLIRMIEVYLGPDTFRDGLRLYLKRHAYANATTDDLWQALEEVSQKPVKSIMESWTKQAGYPVLTIQPEPDGQFRVTQSRFLSSPEPLTPEEEAQLWQIPIPLGIAGSQNQEQRALFMQERQTLTRFSHAHGWVKLNMHQVAFLRIDYLTPLRQALAKAIHNNELGPIDRFGVISDLAALVKAGKASATELFNLFDAYRDEMDYTVWMELLGIMETCKNLLAHTACFGDFEKFGRWMLARTAVRLGWDKRLDEAHTTALLRPAILRALGGYNEPSVIREAKILFDKFIENASSLHPNLRLPIWCIAAEQGNEETYEALVAHYATASLQEEKVRTLQALGKFRNTVLLKQVLEFALSPAVRSQDAIFPVASVAANPLGRDLAWEFFRAHWDEFNKRYSSGGLKLLARYIAAVCGHFTSTEKSEEVEVFFGAHPAPSAERTIRQAVEQIRTSAAWLLRDGQAIAAWLAAWKK